jgi:ferritin-like metal-binding protein YciE
MALFAGKIQDLKALYIHQLRLMLSTERQIKEALPEMEDGAADAQLTTALRLHREETQLHAFHLEQILRALVGDDEERKCGVITALIGAGKDIIKHTDEGPLRDIGIIASAQRVEHFEIASYGTLRTWAQMLGFNDHAATIDTTLQQEHHADETLTSIAERLNSRVSAKVAA